MMMIEKGKARLHISIIPVLRRVNPLTVLGILQHETICLVNGGVDIADSVSRRKQRSFDVIETG
jgi:hypothetical protein